MQDTILEHGENSAYLVLRAIRQIIRRISAHSSSLNRDVGLTVPQLLCLKAVGEMEDSHDEITVAMVGERVQLSAATVSRIIDRLARSGLIERERRSKDRRRVCVALSPSGKQQFKSLPTPLQEQFVERFAALPEPDQQRLLQALSQIAELMGAADIDAAPILELGEDISHERQEIPDGA